MPKFEVDVIMHETYRTTITVEAGDEEKAKELAEDQASDVDFDEYDREDCWYEADPKHVKEVQNA